MTPPLNGPTGSPAVPHPASAGGIAVILLAAGGSSRMGGVDKLWADLGGAPLVARSLHTLATLEGVADLVIVAPSERHRALCGLAKGVWGAEEFAVRCVEGGARRQDSVASGIAAAPEATWYLVHDAARPLASAEMARRVLDAARDAGAAIPALPMADTIKRVQRASEDGPEGVAETLDRTALRAVQTPQAFAGDVLRRAHAQEASGGGEATDDAALVERLGLPVVIVEGEATNLKVTTPDDLAIVRALLGRLAEEASCPRP